MLENEDYKQWVHFQIKQVDCLKFLICIIQQSILLLKTKNCEFISKVYSANPS